MMNDKKLRIAMLGHKRIPSREGGVEVVVEELSTRMVQRGHAVTCYNRGGHHVSGREYDVQKQKTYQGVRLKTVWTLDKKGLAAMTSSLFSAIEAGFGRYDVVHFHAEGPCAMLWLPKLLGKRCIATIHGLDWQRAKWKQGLGAKYIKIGEKVAAKYADEIIVLSKEVQSYFQVTYGRDTVFIPNGVNRPKEVAPEEITARYGLEKDGYILFLGRLVPEKGVHYLIEAFQNVRTDKKLVIAGGVSDTEDYLEMLKKLAAPDPRILFTGFVQGKLLGELYSSSYLYVLPSDLEGMPLSLLEAMSYGNCCLTSDIAECADVLANNGVTFHKADIRDLTEKLQYLVDNEPVVQNYKTLAADYICHRYNWDRIVDETIRLYQKLDSTQEQ